MSASVSMEAPRSEERRRAMLLAYASTVIAATAVSAAIALDGAASHAYAVATARALIVGVPLGVGLYAWYSREEARFGVLLILAGGGWFVTTLAESGDALPYTLGRAAGWLMELALVYLILAYPSGRLPGRSERLIVLAMAVAVFTMYLPRLVLAEDFEVPSPFTSCVRACPENAFFALDREPGFVKDFMRPVGVLLVFVALSLAVARLTRRVRGSALLTRRMIIPVVAVGGARAGAVGVALVARQLDPTTQALEVVSWALALAVPLLALAFLAGLLRWRLFAGVALKRLSSCLHTVPDASTLRQAFADSFDDPSIEILFPSSGPDGTWIDDRGHPVELPERGSGRASSEVRNGDAVVAAIVHDESLAAHPELVTAGADLAAVVLANHRLVAEAEAAARELRQSRSRIAARAAQERRRIERDIHDGAQQRLVALGIELELTETILQTDPDRGLARLRRIEEELGEAVEELRLLAHGVYPPLLADRGLPDALHALARRSPFEVEFQMKAVGRYGPEVESAIYFCLSEALQNVTKHARTARHVVVRVDGGTPGELQFGVLDDGSGASGVRIHPGAGLTNMQDRVAALGGEVEVTSVPGVGTTVQGRMPLSPPQL
jgi:signal transduction histidine kinase